MAKQTAKDNQQLVPMDQAGGLVLGGYEDDARDGFQESSQESFAIPMLRILHKQSPQCDPDNGLYVTGAKQGSIFNTVTREIFDNVIVVPCHYRMTYIEWVPRTAGGGFVAEHRVKPADAVPQHNGPDLLPSGNEVVETMNHYCMVLKPDGSGADPVIISMTSVQRKKSRNWMTTMRSMQGQRADGSFYPMPMYAVSYRLSTVPEQNEKGNWAGWLIDKHGWVKEGSALYLASKELKKACQTDTVEVEREYEEDRVG